MKKKIILIVSLILCLGLFCSCSELSASGKDTQQTIAIANGLAQRQPTPTDIDYSLERYNLIRRAYWVNGEREKALSYPCAIANIPMGYVVLFTEGGGVVGRFCVEGKVTSLNSYLTPDSEAYEGTPSYMRGTTSSSEVTGKSSAVNKWLADVDGSYGMNDTGIFFFTPDGKYVEWSGTYLYSDIPFEISDPTIKYEEN